MEMTAAYYPKGKPVKKTADSDTVERRVKPASKKETFLQFYFSGDDPVFICGINGHMTIDCLEKIEEQANHSMREDDYFQEGAGDYLFKVYQESPEMGENGETSYSGCWILDQIEFKPLKA